MLYRFINQQAATIAASFFLFCLLVCHTPLICHMEEFSTVGTIYPSSKSVIGSQVAGKVNHVYVEIGQEVSKGQPLIELDATFFKIDLAKRNSALESTRIELADSKTNFLRMQRLWEKKDGEAPSISLKKFEEAKSKYELAVIQVKQNEEDLHRAEVNLAETVIRAPFSGVITKKFIDKGESVCVLPPTEIIEIQSLNPVYLEFSIPQNHLSMIHVGTPIQYVIDGTDQFHSNASIDLIYPCIDEKTRSLRCRAVLNNQDHKIKPGLFAKITIKGETL